jgi:hypothetical protein
LLIDFDRLGELIFFLARLLILSIDIVRKKISREKSLLNITKRTNCAKQERLEPCIIEERLIIKRLFLELRDLNSALNYIGLKKPD